MRQAILASTARTPIGKAYRGAGFDGGGVDDVILGCAAQQGSSGVTGISVGHPCGMTGARLVGHVAGRPGPGRALCRNDDVRRRRHGRGGSDRGGVVNSAASFELRGATSV